MKFSIGIPAFKASYLKECINSVLQQTRSDFELIIVNDASPEDVDSIVSMFSDDRIQYYKNEKNIGGEHVVDNWNKCLSFAKGEFFVLLGDDDLLEPDYLEEFDKLIRNFPLKDVFHCRSYIINERSEQIGFTPSWPQTETVYENIWHRLTEKREQFISDFVYRTKALRAKGGFFKLPLAWGSDDLSAYNIGFENGLAHSNKPVFNYRRTEITISSSGNFQLKQKALTEALSWLKKMMIKEPNNHDDRLFRKLIQAYLDEYYFKTSIYGISDYYAKRGLLKSISILTLNDFSFKIKMAALFKVVVSKVI